MALVTPERMYSLYYNGATEQLSLVARPSFLVLDDPSEFLTEADTLGPIHVRDGLTGNDVACFLQFYTDTDSEEPLPEAPVGYLVSAIQSDPKGSGILISGQLLETDPHAWTSPRLDRIWRLLGRYSYTPDQEFGLTSFTKYLQSRGLLG